MSCSQLHHRWPSSQWKLCCGQSCYGTSKSGALKMEQTGIVMQPISGSRMNLKEWIWLLHSRELCMLSIFFAGLLFVAKSSTCWVSASSLMPLKWWLDSSKCSSICYSSRGWFGQPSFDSVTRANYVQEVRPMSPMLPDHTPLLKEEDSLSAASYSGASQ